MEKIVSGKLIIYNDKKYKFTEIFNPHNGLLIRSNIHNTNINPIERTFPELLDIGIMGHCNAGNNDICKKAGVDCYQKAKNSCIPNMSLDDYKKIILQCKNKVFQVALGGAGDPNKHENFEEILKITREMNIVPNLTTSGFILTDEEINLISNYCGAVAVSFYTRLIRQNNFYIESNENTIKSIHNLLNANCKTNIHYVLSSESIDEAIIRLKENLFPIGVNAIIFILYKPVGYGKKEKTISLLNQKFSQFIELIESNEFPYKIGFDTCCTPALVKKSKFINMDSVDFCEAARFSMYIDSQLNAYPCSFDCDRRNYMVSLKNITIKEAWNSIVFKQFKEIQNNSCKDCVDKAHCLGGCPLDINLNVCGQKN